jgi:hypothetical protein
LSISVAAPWTPVGEDHVARPSGIGFVNFGAINRLDAPIETFDRSARGFNVDAGTVNTTEFERLVTHADGAVGVHISQQPSHLPFSKGSK